MDYITILVFVFVYLISFVGLGIYVDQGHEEGKLNADEYRRGVHYSYVPVINTLALIVCLTSALVHWLSFGMWNKNPKA